MAGRVIWHESTKLRELQIYRIYAPRYFFQLFQRIILEVGYYVIINSNKATEVSTLKQLMLGNEAIARGAYEAGVRVSSAYPGTPSTEINENVANYPEIYCE